MPSADPINSAGIQHREVSIEAVKLEILRHLMHGPVGSIPVQGDAVRFVPRITVNAPGVTVNPDISGPYEPAHVNVQPVGAQPVIFMPPSHSTAPQAKYQPFSSSPATQTALQSTTSVAPSGFFSNASNQTTASTQAPLEAQQPQTTAAPMNPTSSAEIQQKAPQSSAPQLAATPSAPSQSQATQTAQTSPNQGPVTQQPSQISPLLAPPSGSLQSGSLAGYIQNLLASMTNPGSTGQLQAILVQTPFGGATASLVTPSVVAPSSSQAVQIHPNVPGTSLHSSAPIDPSPVSNKPPGNQPQNPSTVAERESALRADVGQPASQPGGLPAGLRTSSTPASPELAPQTAQPVSLLPTPPQSPQQSPPGSDSRAELNLNPRHQEQQLPPNTSPRDALVTTPSQQQPPLEIVIQPLPYRPEQQLATQQEQINQQQQRTERLRDIQQIIAAEREPLKPIVDRTARPPESQTSPRQEQTHAAVERVRESILDKLTNIQSRIETASSERRRLEDARGPRDMRIQGRDTLVRPDPIHHDTKPSLIIKLAERLQENQQAARMTREPLVGLASATAIERARIRRIDSTSPLLGASAASSAQPLRSAHHDPDKLSNLIDLLKRFSQRSINFSLLNKMDTSLERACLTIVTGAALGYLGIEILYRASTLVILQTLAALRDEDQTEQDTTDNDDQEELEQHLAADLEEFTTAELSTVGEQGFVVDLAGIVLAAHSGEPLGHVQVHCSEFGSCSTDSGGRFLFPNIPLGIPYTLTVSSNAHNLTPVIITGVSGTLGFITIRVQVA
jgi:hypothetical protein